MDASTLSSMLISPLPPSFLVYCDNTPPANPHYLNHPNYAWPSDCLVVSLIFGQAYFTFLYGHTKHNIHNREDGRKENNKHGLGLAPSARREEFVTLLRCSPCICRLLRACIRTKFPQSHLECWLIFSRWPTRPDSTGSSSCLSSLDYRLPPTSVDWSVLPPSLDWLLLLRDLPFPRPLPDSWEISHASPLCGFHAKTDKGIHWLAPIPTPTETNATHRVTPLHLWDVRSNTSSSVFFFSVPFDEVFPLPTSRIVPSILRGAQLRYLSLW